jgi:guanine deaminase
MMNEDTRKDFMRQAIQVALESATDRGGPFGAVVVKDGQVIARAGNRVTCDNDPTAHAEIVAIREACRLLGTHQLTGCEIYASSEPCPMCLSAIYWARPDRFFYAASWADAAAAGFDDKFISEELALPPQERAIPVSQIVMEESQAPFDAWSLNDDRVEY